MFYLSVLGYTLCVYGFWCGWRRCLQFSVAALFFFWAPDRLVPLTLLEP